MIRVLIDHALDVVVVLLIATLVGVLDRLVDGQERGGPLLRRRPRLTPTPTSLLLQPFSFFLLLDAADLLHDSTPAVILSLLLHFHEVETVQELGLCAEREHLLLFLLL